MHDLAEANATAEINVEVPKPQYFSATNAAGASSSARRRPARAAPARAGHGCFKRLRIVLGRGARRVGHGVDGLASPTGWAGNSATGRRSGPIGTAARWPVEVLILAYMREQLNAHNLKSTYPRGRVGRLPERRTRDRLRASAISAPPTEAGTTSRIPRRALPARASCAMSSSQPPARDEPAIARAEPARDQPPAARAPGRLRWPTRR